MSAEGTYELDVPVVSERLIGCALGKERGTHRDRVRAAVQSAVACGRALGRGRYIQSQPWIGLRADPYHGNVFVVGLHF